MVIYYDTKTGNVRRFIDKLLIMHPTINAININDVEVATEKGHLITFTIGAGYVPVTTAYFMERYHNLILSVSSSGNRNWGRNFALSANILSAQYDKIVGHKFELAGFDEDVIAYSKVLLAT